MTIHRCLANLNHRILHINALKQQPDGKFILATQRRLKKNLQLHLTAQLNFVLREIKGEFTNSIKTNVPKKIKELPYKEDIANDIYLYGTDAASKSIKSTVSRYKLGRYGIGYNDVKYKTDVTLKKNLSHELSNAKGNIDDVTVSRINDIVYNGYQEGKTYSQMRDLIIEQGSSGVFSPYRAELIAVHEVGWAYEEGKLDSFKTLQEKVPEAKPMKMWQTVGDSLVTETHTENENEGWVELDHIYDATGGDEAPPASDNPNCRCVELYRID